MFGEIHLVELHPRLQLAGPDAAQDFVLHEARQGDGAEEFKRIGGALHDGPEEEREREEILQESLRIEDCRQYTSGNAETQDIRSGTQSADRAPLKIVDNMRNAKKAMERASDRQPP
ncbi:MAG: hypothetical protein V4803_25640 [Burkholderia gladioli]